VIADIPWQKLFEMPQIAIVVGCVFGCMVPIMGVIASFWYKAQKMRSDNELKQSMVERGLSVDEIERVLAAQSQDERH